MMNVTVVTAYCWDGSCFVASRVGREYLIPRALEVGYSFQKLNTCVRTYKLHVTCVTCAECRCIKEVEGPNVTDVVS